MMQIHLERDIPYIPCAAHQINTAVEHNCNASESVCALFDILQELFISITSSTKRYDVYSDKLKQSNEEPIKLKLHNVSGTSWVAGEESIHAVWSSYAIILEVLEGQTNSKYDMKTQVKATALRDKMKSFNFIVMLMFMKKVIGKTKCLTTEIQSINMNIIDTTDSFKATISTLEQIRNNNDGLDNQIHGSKSFAEQHGIDPNT